MGIDDLSKVFTLVIVGGRLVKGSKRGLLASLVRRVVSAKAVYNFRDIVSGRMKDWIVGLIGLDFWMTVKQAVPQVSYYCMLLFGFLSLLQKVALASW